MTKGCRRTKRTQEQKGTTKKRDTYRRVIGQGQYTGGRGKLPHFNGGVTASRGNVCAPDIACKVQARKRDESHNSIDSKKRKQTDNRYG